MDLGVLKGEYTVDDYYAMDDDVRRELIWGRFYDMAAPTVQHQRVLNRINNTIFDYINKKGGDCEVFPAPFDVNLLPEENNTMVEPDICVICDSSKIENGKCCMGAPDWVIEITSPSSQSRDYLKKANAYISAGVREYWIVDLISSCIIVYSNIENGEAGKIAIYGTSSTVPVGIYEDLEIDFGQIIR